MFPAGQLQDVPGNETKEVEEENKTVRHDSPPEEEQKKETTAGETLRNRGTQHDGERRQNQ